MTAELRELTDSVRDWVAAQRRYTVAVEAGIQPTVDEAAVALAEAGKTLMRAWDRYEAAHGDMD